MEKHKCSRCGERKLRSDNKERSEYHRRTNGKWYAYCKLCHSQYTKSHYRQHKTVYLAKARRYDAEYKKEIHVWLYRYFQEHPCVDCDETNPIVLEFDHRDDTDKIAAVSLFVQARRSIKSVQREVAKCDVRCSNCHKKRTAVQQNWYWIKFLSETAPSATG